MCSRGYSPPPFLSKQLITVILRLGGSDCERFSTARLGFSRRSAARLQTPFGADFQTGAYPAAKRMRIVRLRPCGGQGRTNLSGTNLDTLSVHLGCGTGRPHLSTTDTRIFSEQISRSSVTQGNATDHLEVNSRPGRLPRVTVGDPGLGTKMGTKSISSVLASFMIAE